MEWEYYGNDLLFWESLVELSKCSLFLSTFSHSFTTYSFGIYNVPGSVLTAEKYNMTILEGNRKWSIQIKHILLDDDECCRGKLKTKKVVGSAE